jgi:hypothetical protein
MKKLMVLVLVLSMAASAFAENGLAVSGQARTGLDFNKKGDKDPTMAVKNSDEGNTPGRFRLDFNYTKDNIQAKWRMQMEGGDDQLLSNWANIFAYAFVMGDFFDNQFRVSVGKLGDSGDRPLETSGDEVWGSIEEITGARFEFKPAAVAGLNLILLMPALADTTVKPNDYLSELGLGVRYDNDLFGARFGIRLGGSTQTTSTTTDTPATTTPLYIDDDGSVVDTAAGAT